MNQQTLIFRVLTPEEQSLLCFEGSGGYQSRLQEYWEYPQGLAERTTLPDRRRSLSTTQRFRSCLRRFIGNFQPEPLLPRSPLWLHLESNGRFSVRWGEDGEELTTLNREEFWAFQFLCFLHLRRFWDSLRECCRSNRLSLPLFIQDFSDKTDTSAHYEALVRQAFRISDLVIVL